MRRRRALLPPLLVMLALAGCSTSPTAADDPAPPSVSVEPTPYTGPLVLRAPSEEEARLSSWPGAAGRAVRCRGPVVGGSHASPYSGGEVRDDIAASLDEARSEGQIDLIPDGLREVRRDGSRVLLGYENGGRLVAAVVMRRGPVMPRAGAGPDGIAWWPESYARCDWADFPESVTKAMGTQVWRDAQGRRVPTTSVVSAAGAEHCDWQGMTFLHVGGDMTGDVYVRMPAAELGGYFAERFREHVRVPRDAVDTGWHRGDAHLWLALDRSVAYVGPRAGDVEQWPRTIRPLGCA